MVRERVCHRQRLPPSRAAPPLLHQRRQPRRRTPPAGQRQAPRERALAGSAELRLLRRHCGRRVRRRHRRRTPLGLAAAGSAVRGQGLDRCVRRGGGRDVHHRQGRAGLWHSAHQRSSSHPGGGSSHPRGAGGARRSCSYLLRGRRQPSTVGPSYPARAHPERPRREACTPSVRLAARPSIAAGLQCVGWCCAARPTGATSAGSCGNQSAASPTATTSVFHAQASGTARVQAVTATAAPAKQLPTLLTPCPIVAPLSRNRKLVGRHGTQSAECTTTGERRRSVHSPGDPLQSLFCQTPY